MSWDVAVGKRLVCWQTVHLAPSTLSFREGRFPGSVKFFPPVYCRHEIPVVASS